ncbi:MAG: monovalent cation/H+ antiporter complex subunit F [Thermoguttaceae bacterium]|jgi:multicomponent Na+:H+ antiporter subunit F|nr:monovalent cation/H+ antiporter complex subunit F [Thermoguttaceae bacterium]
MIPLIIVVLVVASVACFGRVIAGPTVPDRIAAVDVIGLLLALVFVLLGVHYRNPFFYDVALVYAVLLFADALILAKFIERGELHG